MLQFRTRHRGVLVVAGRDGEAYFPSEQLAANADILAPSEQLFSTVPGGRHNFLDGISMSSAIVSGVIALRLTSTPLTTAEPKHNGRDFCAWINGLTELAACPPPDR